jgi:hypothetical protein
MASQVSGLFNDYFQTPEQIRKKQQEELLGRGQQNAAMLLQGNSGGRNSGLANAIRSYGASLHPYIPQATEGLKRGMLEAAGYGAQAAGRPEMAEGFRQAAMSPEEARAAQMQEKLRKTKGDYAGLMALGQELLQSGDTAEAYSIMMLAKEMKPEAEEADINTMDTNDMKNIAAIGANEFGCDVRRDKQCFLKAKQSYIDLKRADTAQQKMEVFGYEGLNKRRDEAALAAQNINKANDALKLLDTEKVIVGAFAKTRQGAIKMASQLFGWQEGKEAVANTALLMAETKTMAGELLATGMYGSGTAISDRDLKTVQEIAGADENLTPESMKFILEWNQKLNAEKIKRHNDRLGNYSEEFWGRTPEGGPDSFRVETPSLYKTQNVGATKEPEKISVYEESLDQYVEVPLGATVGTHNGKRGYALDGKFYPFDGSEAK